MLVPLRSARPCSQGLGVYSVIEDIIVAADDREPYIIVLIDRFVAFH